MTKTITIVIDELTDAHRIAIEDMLATWVSLASQGSSKWTAFYADGDGNFHPKITVDGKKPEITSLLTYSERWKNGEYKMDYDNVAYALRNKAKEDAK